MTDAFPLAVGFWVFGFGILGAFALVLWVVGLVDLFGSRDDLDTRQKAGWLLLIVLLPILGTIYYWIRRPTQDSEREKLFRDQTRGH
jgi:hypothetical protein